MYDVIIVGAGPAGSTAAKTLAERGFSVLLVEKFKMPRYKSCSGQLINRSIELVRRYFGTEIPRSVMCMPTENRGMIFTDDIGREYRFEQDALNVWRSSFDHFLAVKAMESGAEVCDETSVTDCADMGDKVEVRLKGKLSGQKTARYLIDCEGVVGALKRKITGGTGQYVYTFQTYNRGSVDLDPHYFYAYLQPEFSGYDAWMNIKDGMPALGVSAQDGESIKGYYESFLKYMTENHGLCIDEELRRDKWLMPYVSPGCPVDLGKGRILYAGEIAGFVNPMGEGVSSAIESGRQAGLAVACDPDSPYNVAAAYRMGTEALRDYMKRQWNVVANMAGTFSNMRI